MEFRISDLPEQFTNIAKKIGIENTKELFREFGGTSVYFPTQKTVYKNARDREIIKNFTGFNEKELAIKYNMSENYIKSIIKRQNMI